MLKLPERLHISHIDDFTQQLKHYIAKGEPVVIDASAVENADTSALQALCVVQKQLLLVDQHIQWLAVSDAFRKSTATLGLTQYLQLD